MKFYWHIIDLQKIIGREVVKKSMIHTSTSKHIQFYAELFLIDIHIVWVIYRSADILIKQLLLYLSITKC